MKNYIVEFIGTFFLMFTIGMVSINPGPALFSPIAIGLMLMVMVYAGGHVSGAHYNPAVTLAVYIRGKIEIKDAIIYVLVQSVAAAVVSLIVLYLKGNPVDVQVMQPRADLAFISELIITYALCYVVLMVTTSPRTEGNSYFGLAIGCTVIAGAYSVATIAGAFFNPAVTIGQTVFGKSAMGDIWIYFTAQFAAGLLAGLTYKVVNKD